MSARTMLGAFGSFLLVSAAVGIGGDSLMQANLAWSALFLGATTALVAAWWWLLYGLYPDVPPPRRGPDDQAPVEPNPGPSGLVVDLDGLETAWAMPSVEHVH